MTFRTCGLWLLAMGVVSIALGGSDAKAGAIFIIAVMLICTDEITRSKR